MQEHEITVIPTIRASTDLRSFEWYLDGEPKHSIIAVSSMWLKEGTEIYAKWEQMYQMIADRLQPQKIFVYGEIPKNMKHKNVERIEKFTEKRWNKL